MKQKSKNIIISPTATGKTLSFIIPLLNNLTVNPHYFHSIILAPTKELALQINEQIQLYSGIFGLYSNLMIGGQGEQLEYSSIIEQGCYIIVSTPGCLKNIFDCIPQEELIKKFSQLEFLVLDEFDLFLTGDEDMNNYFESILKVLPNSQNFNTILSSASYPQYVQDLVNNSNIKWNLIKYPPNLQEYSVPENLQFKAIKIPSNDFRLTFLLFLLQCITGVNIKQNVKSQQISENQRYQIKNPNLNQILIFANSSEETEKIYRILIKNKFNAIQIHSKINNFDRITNLQEFRNRKYQILVSTDICSRGLDISDIQYVINYQLPQTIEQFQHRAGRAGRVQDFEAYVYSLYTHEEEMKIQKLNEKLNIEIEILQQIKNWSLQGEETEIKWIEIVQDYFNKASRDEIEVGIEMNTDKVGRKVQKL